MNQKTLSKTKVRKHRSMNILVSLLGFSAAFGERANTFFPLASRTYIIIGMILVLATPFTREVRRVQVKAPSTLKLLAAYYVFFGFVTLFFEGNFSIDNTIEGLKLPLFIWLALTLTKLFVIDWAYFDRLCVGFLLGFWVAVPLGVMEAFTVERFCGTYSNPNTYAVDCCFAIYAALFLLRNKKYKWLKVILAFAAFVPLLLTGSRGALAAASVGIAFLIFDVHNVTFVSLSMSLLLVVGAVSLFLFGDNIPTLQRLLGSALKENVRFEIWRAYLGEIDQFFWFGVGEASMRTIHRYTPHSALLGPFVRYGVIAFVLNACVNIQLLRASLKVYFSPTQSYANKVICCLFFTWFLFGLTMETDSMRVSYIFLSAVLAIVAPKQKVASHNLLKVQTPQYVIE